MRTRADDPEIQAIAEEAIAEAGGADVVAPPGGTVPLLATERVLLDGRLPFELPLDGPVRELSIDILRGRYRTGLSVPLAGRTIHRVLDAGAGVGAFAAWAAVAWPQAWVDCVEDDEALADVCRRNLPLGAALVTAREAIQGLEADAYDLVRVGTSAWLFVSDLTRTTRRVAQVGTLEIPRARRAPRLLDLVEAT